MLFCCRQGKKYGITEDNVYDMMIWQIPLCIIGARLYYVLFNLDFFRRTDGSLNLGKMIAIWDGGLAIYGAVIVAFFVLMVFCKKKKLSFGAFADLGVMGLLIGQSVGRWGNFVNREVFGGETSVPWRMRVWVSASEYIEVHPTFLYESLWNLLGLALLLGLELAVGYFLGLVMNIFFYIPMMGGETIDIQMGMSMGKTYDPGSQSSVSVTASMFNILMILLFFTANGHHTLMRIILVSGRVVPFGSVVLGQELYSAVLELFIECTIMAIKLCMPILAAELIAQMGMGILMKVIPQINVFPSTSS